MVCSMGLLWTEAVDQTFNLRRGHFRPSGREPSISKIKRSLLSRHTGTTLKKGQLLASLQAWQGISRERGKTTHQKLCPEKHNHIHQQWGIGPSSTSSGHAPSVTSVGASARSQTGHPHMAYCSSPAVSLLPASLPMLVVSVLHFHFLY